MTSSRLPFLLSAIVLVAAFPANGHAGTYNDTANGITFSFTTSDAPPYTATITDVSFYQDPDPNPVNPGDPVCVPGTPIDPNDPDSELYYPTYASVQFPDSVISDEGGGPMQYTVTAIASHVLEGLAGAMGNGGAIDVTLSTAMYGGLVTIEDGAFSLWNPQPDPDASSIAVTVSDGSFPDSLEYFGYQSTSVAFNSTESDSQGVEYQGDWVVGFVPNSGRPQQVINLHRAKGIVGGAFEYASPRIVSVILPSTLKAIPTRAFAGCTGLGKLSGKGTVTIPASVEIIGECAFQGDSYITNFVFEGDAPQVGPNAFDGVGSSVLNLPYGDIPTATVHTGTSGWGPEGSIWNGLRVTYAAAPTSYTITWRDDDNTLLSEETWPVGSRPTHEDLVKDSDSQYTYTFAGWTPAISVVTSNTTYTAVYSSALQSYPITWLNEDGSTFAQTSVAYGTVPAYNGQPPVKAPDAQYEYAFAGWTPDPVAVRGPASYTATFTASPRVNIIDLSTLSGDYTASDGDILTNATAHVVTVPGGATVTINGVTVTGGGAGNSPATFAEGGEAFTSAFAQGANGTWRLTAYAELASGSAAGLADSQIKVRRADTVAGLATAEPTSTGVTVLEKVPAVKVELDVAVPAGADSQFFRVEFGE